jgi:glycosyltransferase involved in cell wall biosynthesis
VADTRGFPEIVRHSVTGIVTRVNNPDSLAWGIFEVLNNPEYACWLVSNAREDLQKRFH